MPPLARRCLKSWKKVLGREYSFVLWDEHNFSIHDAPAFVRDAYTEKKYAFVSDYVRLWCVYHYGGIYLDTDVELIRDFGDLVSYDAFFAFEASYDNIIYNVATGLGFGSIARHPLLKELLMIYSSRSYYRRDGMPNLIPCPVFDRPVFSAYGFALDGSTQIVDNVIVLSPSYMCPRNLETGVKTITNHTISIHHFASSWANKSWRYYVAVIKKCIRNTMRKMRLRFCRKSKTI